ncbi:MAG: hypothetical protein NVSMB45_15890 [Ginsengibacter sp.]
MKRLVFYFVIILLGSCNTPKSKPTFNDPLESGREFIDASLKGDYDRAKTYMLIDSTNIRLLESLQDFYKKMTPAEKEGYKNANIIINPSEAVTDSTQVINYTNTYKNKPSRIKVVKKSNEWRVDFKYTFSTDL